MDNISKKLIVFKNIKKNIFRSLFLILIVSVLVTILILGNIVSSSLVKGIDNLSNKLGADIIIVPQGYKSNIESVLLKGEPSEFFLPKKSLEKINEIEGVELLTPQLYVATLSADCCSYPVQMIGIEEKSDFLIKSWLESEIYKLDDNNIIVGNHIVGEIGDTVKFFDREFIISARLQQTGLGFDSSVFVNMNTARNLYKTNYENNNLSEDEFSTILIKLKSGYNSVEVSNKIMKDYSKDGIFAMFSKKFINDISSNLTSVSNYIKIFIIVVAMLCLFLISFIFTVIINEKMREFSILRIIGASKKYISKLILLESIYISIYGFFVGVIISSLLMVGVFPILKNKLSIPFIIPNISKIFLIIIFSMIISFATCIFSCLLSFNKINKIDAYISLRERE